MSSKTQKLRRTGAPHKIQNVRNSRRCEKETTENDASANDCTNGSIQKLKGKPRSLLSGQLASLCLKVSSEISLLHFYISTNTGWHIAGHYVTRQQNSNTVGKREHGIHVVLDKQDCKLPLELT
jgi:hypothetical protein